MVGCRQVDTVGFFAEFDCVKTLGLVATVEIFAILLASAEGEICKGFENLDRIGFCFRQWIDLYFDGLF